MHEIDRLAAKCEDDAHLLRSLKIEEELATDRGAEPTRLLDAIELVEETRRRFQLNVSEELACEALAYRLERLLGK